MYFLAGIGARLSGFVQSARDAEATVTIDGCPLGCAKAVPEQAGIPNKRYQVLTGPGIEQNKNLTLKKEEVQKVMEAVRKQCE